MKETLIINNSKYIISKINDTVYKVGDIDFNFLNKNFNMNFFLNIASLLNKGSKFIPCYYTNKYYFFSNLIYCFQNFLQKLNTRIFFINNNSKKINKDYLYLTSDNLNNLSNTFSESIENFKIDNDFLNTLLNFRIIESVCNVIPNLVENMYLFMLPFKLYVSTKRFRVT